MKATSYKFRQTRLADNGRRYVIQASDGPGAPLVFGPGELAVGSPAYHELVNDARWIPNNLADEGKIDVLDVYFDDVAVRSSLFGRLFNDTPVDTDTLATLTGEVTGTGYGSVTFTRGTDWGNPSIVGANANIVGVPKTYTAGGAWTAATYFVLATVTSGTAGLLIAYATLGGTYTLANTDTLEVTPTVTMA